MDERDWVSVEKGRTTSFTFVSVVTPTYVFTYIKDELVECN